MYPRSSNISDILISGGKESASSGNKRPHSGTACCDGAELYPDAASGRMGNGVGLNIDYIPTFTGGTLAQIARGGKFVCAPSRRPSVLAKAMEQMDSTVKQASASVINLLKLDILISFLLSWHLRGISVIL